MPKYITYGDYDDEKNTYTGDTEKEVSSADILRGNEEVAVENTPESDEKNTESGKSDEKKDGFYKKSTAAEANSRETKASDAEFLNQVSGKKGKTKGGRFTKRFAPLLLIMALTGAGAIGVGFSQVMMPFHVVESLTEMTDGSFTARQARMPRLVRWMFNMEMETDATTKAKSWFNLKDSSKLRYRKSIKSERVQNRLKAEGIDVDTDGGTTVLKYHQADGSIRTVTADEYTELWRNDSDFRNRMNRGGRSFLGRIAAHIDLTLANFLNSHNLTKNLFKNWINKVYDTEGQTVRLHNVIEERKPKTTGNTGAIVADDDGGDDTAAKIKGETDIDADMDASTMKTKYTEMVSNIANLATGAVCGTAAVLSAVTAAKVVIAYENARGAFSGIAESVDKVKAGNGNESPINASADTMMKRDADGRTMLQSESMKWALSGGTYTPDKNAEDVKSSSIDAIYRDGVGGIANGIIASTNFIIGCAVANVVTSAISVIADIASLGAFSVGKFLIGTAVAIGVTEGMNLLVDKLVENAKTNFCLDVSGPNAGACMYLGALKYNGQNFQAGGGSPATKEKAEGFYDAYKVALADEAELIRSTKSPFDVSSSHTFLGSIVSKIGFLSLEMPSLSSVASSLTNLARTSLTSLLPSASAVEKFSYFSNQLRDDCANLQFGDIQALGDLNCEPAFITDQSVNTQVSKETGRSGIDPEEVFAKLKEADSFEVNDNGTLKKQDGNGKLTDSEDGVEIIKEDSLLGKYISYCPYRSSPFGHVDQNIMTKESQFLIDTTKDTGIIGKIKNWLKTLVNNLPIIGEIIDATEAEKQINTIGWSSGANCVARNDGANSAMNVTAIDSSTGEKTSGGLTTITLTSWNDFMRYAQAYVADDRFMQTSYENYVSPVQLFAEKHGLVESDNDLSEVAYLAKYTGYTEENMKIALNELEYWTYIAQYEPEGKGPVVKTEEVESVYDFSTPEVIEQPEVMIADRFVVYADVRNRYAAMV